MDETLHRRKSEHLAIVASGNVQFQDKTTLLEEVELLHDALPELSLADIDLSCDVLGKRLTLPLLIGAMTGGTSEAEAVNRDLAAAAQSEGVGLCLGSQRAMERDSRLRSTYAVRDVAPDILLVGNLGLVRAAQLGAAGVDSLMSDVGADALFVHLNPAMELVQVDGDRDFRGGVASLSDLSHALGPRLWVKETGCGLSSRVATRLFAAGIRTVETAGAGGTSWVAVELAREGAREEGKAFREWGIPTAASVAFCARAGLRVFAGGGLRTGLDVAKAIALGASGAALAAPFLMAQRNGGREAVRAAIRRIGDELRMAALLTGMASVPGLQDSPRVLGPTLRRWLSVDDCR